MEKDLKLYFDKSNIKRIKLSGGSDQFTVKSHNPELVDVRIDELTKELVI
jgi:hypothetical protein